MKILYLIIGLSIANLATGQSADQNDLVAILNAALRDDKLPDELKIKSNPKIAQWTNAPFVVIKSDSSKNIRRLEVPPDSTHVWIFDYSDIFMLDIPFGFIPLSIDRDQERLTLEYKTIKYPTKDNLETTCHLGQIVAERKNGTWTIIKSEHKKMKCDLDFWGLKK